MTITYAIANKKGGVGKTTTTINLAGALAVLGQKVLVVDMDDQANTTYAFTGQRTPTPSLYELLVDTENQVQVTDVLCASAVPGIDILPANKDTMQGFERDVHGTVGEQLLLHSVLAELAPAAYDYILIDLPPSLGTSTINGLFAADEIIIPIEPGVFALQGIQDLDAIIKLIIKRLHKSTLKVAGFLITKKEKTNVAADTLAILQQTFGSQVFTSMIPKNVALEEAHSRKGTIFQHAPHSAGALAYLALAKEILPDDHT